jgi:hypothetical protein
MAACPAVKPDAKVQLILEPKGEALEKAGTDEQVAVAPAIKS